jgi:hypothetical protein
MASQAWQRWTEQRHAEAEGDGGPAEAVLTPKAAVTAVAARAAAPQAGQARAALANREPGWAADLSRCSSAPPRSR